MAKTEQIEFLKSKLRVFKDRIENAEKEKIVASTNLKHFNEEKEKIEKEIAALGYDPNTIKDEIDRLQEGVQSDIDKLTKLVPEGCYLGDDFEERYNELFGNNGTEKVLENTETNSSDDMEIDDILSDFDFGEE